MSEPGPDCLDAVRLGEYLAGELADSVAGRMARHLDTCSACRALLTELTLGEEFAGELAHLFPDGPPRGPITNLRPPEIEGFEVSEEVGRGGMGVVWRGRDHELGRVVAVKVLREKLAGDAAALRRFVSEGRISGQLQHPGVVPIYRLGHCADGRPFISMKLIRGRSLAEIFSERKGSNEHTLKLLAVFQKICETVSYAHSRNVIHRDLKPANVMVGAFGEVQVLDWGLAKLLDAKGLDRGISVITPVSPDSPSLGDSVLGAAVGTPSFMAPEQAAGKPESLNSRADVFSLGGILYELLTHRHQDSRHGEGTERQLRECGGDRELVELARSCLALNPLERPAHAGHVARVVSRYLHSVEQRVREAELATVAAQARAEMESKARRRVVTLGSLVLVAVLIASFAFQRSWRQQSLAATGTRESLLIAQMLFDKGDYEESAKSAELALAQTIEFGGPSRQELEILVRNAELLSRLAKHPSPTHIRWRNREVYQGFGDEYQAAFEEHGLDILGAETRVAANYLRAAGLEDVVRPLLDNWSRIEFWIDGWTTHRGRPLLEIASYLDGNSTRRELREVLGATRDRDELRAFLGENHSGNLDPATLVLLVDCLTVLYRVDDLGDTQDVYDAALRVHHRFPQDVTVMMRLAECCYVMEERARFMAGGLETSGSSATLHEAIEWLSAVGQLDPDQSMAWVYRGEAYDLLGDEESSDKAFSKAVLEIRQNSPYANNEMSFAMAMLENTSFVIARLEQLLDEHPEDGFLWSELAWNLSEPESHRDHQGAIEAARRAHELDPEERWFRNGLFQILYNAGEFAECLAALREWRDLDNVSDSVKLMWAICLHETGSVVEAGELGRSALRGIETAWYPHTGDLFDRGRALFYR